MKRCFSWLLPLVLLANSCLASPIVKQPSTQVVSTDGLIYGAQPLAGRTSLRCTAMLGALKEVP